MSALNSANTAPLERQPDDLTLTRTLLHVFFEPGRTFFSLRERPRFLAAGLIVLALNLLLTFAVLRKVDYTLLFQEQLERSPNAGQMSAEQKEQALRTLTSPLGKFFIYAGPVINTAVSIGAGAGLYALCALLLGGSLGYARALSVWVYSALPPAALGTATGLITLVAKPSDQIDPARGLVASNPSFLIDARHSPALTTLLLSADAFAVYGLFLAVVGLRNVGRLSNGASLLIVVGLWGFNVAFRLLLAALLS